MKEPQRCKSCGAKVVEYRHSMSKSLAGTLIKFARVHQVEAGKLDDCGLTYSERCNFQKLRYWSLVEKVEDDAHKGGVWKLTHWGVSFLRGSDKQKHAVTYRGEIVRLEGPLVNIDTLVPGWKYRPEYAREAVAHQPAQGKLF